MVVACGVLLLVVSIGSLISATLIHREQLKTREAYRRERQRADEAESQFRLARRSVDELLAVSEQELANWPGAEPVRRRLLTSVMSYYQEFIEQRQGNASGQADLLEAKKHVEKILADLAILRAASRLQLLSRPAVLADLGLTVEQRERTAELFVGVAKQWRDGMPNLMRLSYAERGKWFLDQAVAVEADLKAILPSDQLHRLNQIGMQLDVPSAFREPEVSAALMLSSEQRDRIRSIEVEAFAAMLQSLWPDPHPRAGAPFEVNSRPLNARLLAVLTPAQLQQWRAMTGPQFRDSPEGRPLVDR